MVEYNNENGSGDEYGSTGATTRNDTNPSRRSYISKIGKGLVIGTAAAAILGGGILFRYCTSDLAQYRREDRDITREAVVDDENDNDISERVINENDHIEDDTDENDVAYEPQEPEREVEERYEPEDRYDPAVSEREPELEERYEPAIERTRIDTLEGFLESDAYLRGDGELDATLKYNKDGKVITRDLYGLDESDLRNILNLYESTAEFYDDGHVVTERDISSFREVRMPMSQGELRTYNPGHVSDEDSLNLEKMISLREMIRKDHSGEEISREEMPKVDDDGLAEGLRILADGDEGIAELVERYRQWNIEDAEMSTESTYMTLVRLQESGYNITISLPEKLGSKIIASENDIDVMPGTDYTRVGEGDITSYEKEAEPEERETRESRERSHTRPERDERETSQPGFSDDAVGPSDRPHGREPSSDDRMGGRPSAGPRDITRDRDTRDSSSRDQGNDRRDAVDRRTIGR